MSFEKYHDIIKLLKNSVGSIKVNNKESGLAFFIAPGTIITSIYSLLNFNDNNIIKHQTHNLKNLNCIFKYKNIEYECEVEKSIYNDISYEIDAVILSVFIDISHQYVSIINEAPDPGTNLYLYSPLILPINNFSENNHKGNSITLIYEDKLYPYKTKDYYNFKFKKTSINSKYIGTPVLNLKNGYVCGIIKQVNNGNYIDEIIPFSNIKNEIANFLADKNELWKNCIENNKHFEAKNYTFDKKNEILKYLKNKECVNLIIPKNYKWEQIVNDICIELNMAQIDFASGNTRTRKGFIREILKKLGINSESTPDNLFDLEYFEDKIIEGSIKYICFKHFDMVKVKQDYYDSHFFGSLRYLTMEMKDGKKKLVLLIQSHKSITELLPEDHPMSGIEAKHIFIGSEKNEN